MFAFHLLRPPLPTNITFIHFNGKLPHVLSQATNYMDFIEHELEFLKGSSRAVVMWRICALLVELEARVQWKHR